MLTSSATEYSCDTPEIRFSPYVWKPVGAGGRTYFEATMPGAYFTLGWRNSASLSVRIDGTANDGCPSNSMPVISYSVDQGPLKVVRLGQRETIYELPISAGLDKAIQHEVVVYFRAADLQQDRWHASTSHLRIVGVTLDEGGTLVALRARRKRAIAFGDSITEGVGAEGLFTSWNDISMNNACVTWFPIVCAALNCEYGQLGSGGMGMVTTAMEMPPLPLSWDHYDASTLRLRGERLEPQPDYVFCSLGTNDLDLDITSDYVDWLIAARQACPDSRFFCLAPPSGDHRIEVEAAVKSRRHEGDERVHWVDSSRFRHAFNPRQVPTRLAYDGIHPSTYGHSILGCRIAVEVEKILARASEEA